MDYKKDEAVESQVAKIANEMTERISDIPYGDQKEVCKLVCRNIRNFRLQRIEGLDQKRHNMKCEIDAMIEFNKELEKLD